MQGRDPIELYWMHDEADAVDRDKLCSHKGSVHAKKGLELTDATWICHAVITSDTMLAKTSLGHPENYLFSLSKNVFIGSEYPQKKT